MNCSQKKLYLMFCMIILINLTVNAQSPQLIYSTFIGGNQDDRAHGMAIDAQKNVCITAPIRSTNFPLTPNALQSNFTGMMAAKLNSKGDSLVFSTYLGAIDGANYSHKVAFDKEGNIYIAGNTTNLNFPTTANALDRTYNGPSGNDVSHGDAFVMKLNPEGNQIIYSTFIGGSGWDICGKIAVDDEGCAYIYGTTSSNDLPATNGAFDKTYNGGDNQGRGDVFVAKLDASGGNLIYCTYIGGSGSDTDGRNIIVDNEGCVYIAGTTTSSDFPTTTNSYDTSYNGGSGNRGAGDGFLVKLNSDGSSLEYSTFIGGSGDDFGNSIALDDQGNVFVVGICGSSDLTTTSNAFDSTTNNGSYIAEFNLQSSQCLYLTKWESTINDIAVHKSGAIVFSGITTLNNYSVTPNAYDSSINGNNDIFISIFNPATNTLIYSTYFGGSGHDILESILLDDNSLYLCGETTSANFPVTSGSYDNSYNGGTNMYGGDAFVAKFSLNNSLSSIEKTGYILPDKYHLFQNYPNPFNPSTVIGYQLSESSNVKLKIYDTLGSKIKTLVDSNRSAGKYSIVWDGTDELNNPVSSGIYFYSLTTNEINLQKKMILIR